MDYSEILILVLLGIIAVGSWILAGVIMSKFEFDDKAFNLEEEDTND
jgi:predicted permease